MFVSPRYALFDQLSYGSLLLFRCYIYIYIFMSINIAVRPTFEKRAVHFDRGVFANVICLVLIFTSKAEF